MERKAGSVISGMIFGSALTLSGVASPQVIKDQFRLKDFHMLVTFLTASASSAAIIALYNSWSKKKPLLPRSDSSLGWVGRYDGNIIGGAMIGMGMSLTGACPGTVLVQAAAGVGRSRSLLLTSVVAGCAFAKWKQQASVHLPPSNMSNRTVMTATGWSRSAIVVTYEAIMFSAISLALAVASRGEAFLHPVMGGLLIGFGQLSSVLLVEKTVGVSAAYEDFGKMVFDTASQKCVMSVPDSVKFAVGVILGSTLTMVGVPSTSEVLSNGEMPCLLSTLIGGFVLVFGARTAGGCTSGHGISGMAGMSLSSVISVASMFGTGILTSFLVG